MRVLNFGSVNIDYVYTVEHFPVPGETLASRSRFVNCGGKGLNQSIALARAGASVSHACMLGADGEILRAKLAENGVDVSLMSPSAMPSGHAIIEVDSSGQNRILLYGGANRALTAEYIDSTLSAFGSGLVLIQNETNLAPEIMLAAKKAGFITAFNAAPMGPEVENYPIETLEWLIINEVEGAGIAHATAPEAIVEALARRCPDTGVLLTLGRDGAMCRKGDQIWKCASFPVKAVDTTAAGDTFTGFFLAAVLEGKGMDEALRLASAAAALCITRPGASDAVPARAETEEALSSGILG